MSLLQKLGTLFGFGDDEQGENKNGKSTIFGAIFNRPKKIKPDDPGYFDSAVEYVNNKKSKSLLDNLYDIPDARRVKPPSYSDYVQYTHRSSFSEFHLRIGDVCLIVPPEFINIQDKSSVDTTVAVRQASSIKTKHGYSHREIVVSLYFNGIEQINGYEVESPMEYAYYVDGLRSLIAQFKCTPFLPVENEFLNNNGIYTVALQSLNVNTVQGFPDLLQATLVLQEFNVEPYIEAPNILFDDFIDWDLFRYYYQRHLNDKTPIKLNKINNKYLTNNFSISVFNAAGLSDENTKEENKVALSDDNNYTEILNEKENLKIREISFGLTNILPVIQLSGHSTPTMQYMGGMDTIFNIIFEVTSKETLAKFNDLSEITKYVARNFKEFNSIGHLKVKNELINMFGIDNFVVENITVSTVPEVPDLYVVELQCISYDLSQQTKEDVKSMKPFDGSGTKDDTIEQSIDGLFKKIKQDKYIENEILKLELYPDLYLPTYNEIDKAIKKIREFRNKRGLTQIEYDKYPRQTINTTTSKKYEYYMDPDFYIFYPLKYNDTEDDVLNTLVSGKKPKAVSVKGRSEVGSDELPENAYVDKYGNITWYDDKEDTQQSNTTSGVSAGSGCAKRFVELLTSKVGCGYIWGASGEILNQSNYSNFKRTFGSSHYNGADKWLGKQVFDCSGFVSWGLREMGLIKGRYTSDSLQGLCDKVNENELQPGDLCFHPGHVAVYIGDGKTVEALNTNKGVVYSNLYTNILGFKKKRFNSYGRLKFFNNCNSNNSSNTTTNTNANTNSNSNGSIGKTGNTTTDRWDNLILQAASEYKMDPNLLKAIMIKESSGNPNAYNKGSGAKGLTQITKVCADDVGMDYSKMLDPLTNLRCGAKYITKMINKYNGNVIDALAAYNWGPGNYASYKQGKKTMPKETRDYITKIPAIYKTLSGKDIAGANTYNGSYAGSTNDESTTRKKSEFSFISKFLNKIFSSIVKELTGENDFGKPLYAYSPINHLYGMKHNYDKYKFANKEIIDKNDLLSLMCVDMKMYEHKGRLLRAFPTYLLLFVDDNSSWFDGRKLWSNYYMYKSLVDISIHQEMGQPVHTATIRVTNVSRNLSKAKKVNENTYSVETDDEINGFAKWIYKHTGILLTTKITQDIIDNKNNLFESFNLKAGSRIHIRLGYGSNPERLPIAFNGSVSEMDAGDVITIIAQSDGVELINNPISTNKDDTNGLTNLQSEPADIVTSLLIDRQSLWNKILSKNFEANKYGIEHFGLFIRRQREYEYDLCKNIYLGKYAREGFVSNMTIANADGEDNMNMFLYNRTPWDIMQLCAQFLPEFVAQPMYHQFETRLFYGLPYWIAKYKYDVILDSDKKEQYYEYAKTFAQLHMIDSMSDIIDNQLKVNSKNLYTNCVAMYTFGGELKTTPTVCADRSIEFDKQRTKVIDTTTVQDYVGWDWLYAHMPLLNLNTAKSAAIKIAVSNLIESFNNMYQGEIITLADPSIKPLDYLYINDSYTKMTGLMTVREVVHSLSIDTGFTTSITPNLISLSVFNNSGQANVLKSAISFSMQVSAVKLIRYLSVNYTKTLSKRIANLGVVKAVNKMRSFKNSVDIAKHAKNIKNGIFDFVSKGKGVKDTIKTASAVEKAADLYVDADTVKDLIVVSKTTLPVLAESTTLPTVAIPTIVTNIGLAAGTLGTWFIVSSLTDIVLDAIFDYIELSHTIVVYPIFNEGKLFVSGVNGFSKLIPGFNERQDMLYKDSE